MNATVQLRNSLLAGLLLFCVLAGNSAIIYIWVDENGRTQISDTVPEQYRKSATAIDSEHYEVSAEQRQEALERAAREKALADEVAKPRQSAPAPANDSSGSVPVVTKRPAEGVTESTDCATWRRLYLESVDCFAPYRTVRGATKAEAFEKCTPIPEPDPKCGRFSD